MEIWQALLLALGALIPPVNEKMIRAMFRSMGRTPSEKQIREIMRNMNQK